MTRSAKKGPFCEASLVNKVEVAQANKDKKTDQNLVSPFNNSPRLYWSDNCCS